MKLNSTTELVRGILEYVPETREDDYLLWFHVLEIEAARQDHITYFAHSMTLADFLKQAKCCKYPHFETVSRVRRKLQNKYPELRATAETQAARSELEEKYRRYALTDG